MVQINELQRKLIVTNKNIETINSEINKLKDHAAEVDTSFQYYNETHEDLIRKNTDNDSRMDDLERKLEQLEYSNNVPMIKSLMFSGEV